MTPLFKKLNLGTQTTIHVLSAPESFETELQALRGGQDGALDGVKLQRRVTGPVTFALAFVKTLADVEKATEQLTSRAADDAILWMVYPKGSSKRYTCEFNRDTGWKRLGDAGYEPVRQVAIDEDWSALRFRKAEFIKTMTRSAKMALSSTGRKKASGSAR